MKLIEITEKEAEKSKNQFLLVANGFYYVCVNGLDPALRLYRIIYDNVKIRYYNFMKEER